MVEVQTENTTGASCSGSSGEANRVLTLSNTGKTTSKGFLVYVSGLALALTTEYTVVHGDTETKITFLNRLWDDMTIVVNYWEGSSGQLANDFLLGPLNDFGVTATRTPVTMTTDYSGNKTYTDGTDEDVSIVIQPYTKEYKLDEAGNTKAYDLIADVGPSVTLNKYEKITYDSKVYRIDSVSTRDFNGTTIFQRIRAFFIEDE